MKRLTALLLALVFCLSFVYAEEMETGTLPAPEWELKLEESDFAVFSRGRFTGETYREQLDGEYLQIYDAIRDSALGLSETDFTARVSLGFSSAWDAGFTRDFRGNVSVDSAAADALDAYCQEKVALILPALAGLLQDEVELSWLVNATFRVGTDASYAVRWNGMRGEGVLYLDDITFGLRDDSILDAEETGTMADFNAAMEEILEQIDLSSARNRKEMVELLHEFVCEYVSYAEGDLTLRKYQTVASAFDGVTVCAGYAKLFKALCDAYDIPCILVTGESFGVGHMWNYVLMEDGAWYAVDTTWDDQVSWTADEYLLQGADVFGNEHTPMTDWGSGYPYVYPALSESAYALNPAGLSTVNGAQIRTSGAMGLRFISSMDKRADAVEYGTVLIPTEDLSDISELQIGATLNGHTTAKVEAKYLYDEDEDSVTFTAVITNIAQKNYARAYTARAYAVLTDGSVVYGETYTSRSVAEVAQAALERDPNLSDANRELFENIVNG